LQVIDKKWVAAIGVIGHRADVRESCTIDILRMTYPDRIGDEAKSGCFVEILASGGRKPPVGSTNRGLTPTARLEPTEDFDTAKSGYSATGPQKEQRLVTE
jgi:hypothetical protein